MAPSSKRPTATDVPASSRSTTLLVFGAGGHGRVVADAALAQGGWTRLLASDRDPQRARGDLLPNLPLLAPDEAEQEAGAVHIAIGLASWREREARASRLPLATIVHPRASVSPYTRIGAGTFVAAQAVLAPMTVLGQCVIVNHGAVVDHDVEVGDFSHVAPLVALGGKVRIGKRVLVGAGAKILSGVQVCDDVIIGAGAVVRYPIATPGTYVGVPARRVR
jgi:sugar O-acyltransferase (sialic acid O-acetyltransferase NeuD family)